MFLAIFWLCVLFAACFSFVHIALYLLHYVKRAPTPPKTEEASVKPKPEREKKAEPVYYIVEKKSRKKNSYSTPKRIRFD